MILILSNDGDISCDLVQDWLEYYHYPYYRFNAWQFLKEPITIGLNDNHFVITINGKTLQLNKIHAVWLRKYGFFRSSSTYKALCNTGKLNETLINHITKEFVKSIESLIYPLNDRFWLTDPRHYNLNKLEVLKIAGECGLKVPDTFLINTKNNPILQENLICKSVLDPKIASWGENNKSMMYTVKLQKKDQKNIPDSFMPSMVQKLIKKNYELRIFYICGRFYPMAIYSQKDKQTQIDFRNYNWDKPNRMEPCKLDTDTKIKLTKLMKKIKLNCGSIDMIKAKNGDLIFLEVNPTGQFGMVDFPCNYGLHKIVAEELIKMDKKYETKVL